MAKRILNVATIVLLMMAIASYIFARDEQVWVGRTWEYLNLTYTPASGIEVILSDLDDTVQLAAELESLDIPLYTTGEGFYTRPLAAAMDYVGLLGWELTATVSFDNAWVLLFKRERP